MNLSRQAAALQELINTGERLIGVANSHFKSEVITVAEIRYRRKTNGIKRKRKERKQEKESKEEKKKREEISNSQVGGNDDEVLIAVGKHRMLLKKVRQVDRKLFATGSIFEDAPTRIPMEARKVSS